MNSRENRKKKSKKTRQAVLFALLSAVIVLMTVTPLGYLKVGTVEITFLTIPVAVGAIVLGEWWGLALGAIFGSTSFIQCFGASPFGVAMLGTSPLGALTVCILPRILMGYLTGRIFKLFKKTSKSIRLEYLLTSLCASLLNTVFFTVCFVIFFRSANFTDSLGINPSGMALIDVVLIIITVNSVFEAIICSTFGGAISSVISKYGKSFDQ